MPRSIKVIDERSVFTRERVIGFRDSIRFTAGNPSRQGQILISIWLPPLAIPSCHGEITEFTKIQELPGDR